MAGKVPLDVRLEVKGLKELQRDMTKAVAGIRGRKIHEAMRSATLLVMRDARRNAPVDTGRLRASIMPEVRQVAGEVQGIIWTDVEYAAYQEWGTAYVPARLYMTHAVEDNYEKVEKILGQAVIDIVEKGK